MASGSKSASGQKSWYNNSQSIDPETQARIAEIWKAGQGAGASGPSPLLTGAGDYYSQLMKSGGTGMSALGGDADATKQLMNPYMNQVIDATNAQWDKANQTGTMGVNDAATRSGAFGGSRQGVAQGVMLANNNLNRNSQVSGLLSSGFNDAMNRANQLAGYGYNAAGQNANLGFGGVGNPQQWLMQMLNQAYKGPMGQTSNGSQTGIGTTASTSWV